MTRSELSVLFDAEAIALRAKCGRVDPQALAALAHRVAVVDAWQPIGRIVQAMVEARRDPAALAHCGDLLQGSVADALRPRPVDLHRVDIHG